MNLKMLIITDMNRYVMLFHVFLEGVSALYLKLKVDIFRHRKVFRTYEVALFLVSLTTRKTK